MCGARFCADLINITSPHATIAYRLQGAAFAFLGETTPTGCQVGENGFVLRVLGRAGHSLAFLDACPAIVGGFNGVVLHGTISQRATARRETRRPMPEC